MAIYHGKSIALCGNMSQHCLCRRNTQRISDSVVVDFLFIVTPIVGVCNCSMFCCTLLYLHSSLAIILMGKRESWLLCLVCLPRVL